MNDELPEIFGRIEPRPAPAELRGKVLSAIGPHLGRRRKPRWERVVELAVAASFALGIGLNVWRVRSDDAWQTRLFGPLPAPTAVRGGGFVASAADPESGNLVQQQFRSAWPVRQGAGFASYWQYQQLLNELTNGKGQRAL